MKLQKELAVLKQQLKRGVGGFGIRGFQDLVEIISPVIDLSRSEPTRFSNIAQTEIPVEETEILARIDFADAFFPSTLFPTLKKGMEDRVLLGR